MILVYFLTSTEPEPEGLTAQEEAQEEGAETASAEEESGKTEDSSAESENDEADQSDAEEEHEESESLEEEFFVDLDTEDNISVRIGGKEYTREELEEHQKGYLREQDATKKWTEAANIRKKAEIEIESLKGISSDVAVLLDEAQSIVSEWEPEKLEEFKSKREKVFEGASGAAESIAQDRLNSLVNGFANSQPGWVLRWQAY